MFVGFSTV